MSSLLLLKIIIFGNSLLAGNIYVYISLTAAVIGEKKRIPLFVVFSIISAVGLLVFVFIIWRSYVEKRRENPNRSDEPKRSVLADLSRTLNIAGKLLRTRNMLLLLIPFAYSGKALQE